MNDIVDKIMDFESGMMEDPNDVVDFFQEHNVEVLNVAGNCGKNKRVAKNIYNIVRSHLSAYVSAYNKVTVTKDVWTPNDIG